MLNIYRNISVSRETCFFFNNEVQLMDALEPYLFKSIDKKNYLIENNTLSLQLTNSFIASEALEITYVYDTETGIGYNVNSVRIVCGKAILTIARDLWNTYFHKAQITDIVAKRCNRNIGYGVLDEIRASSASVFTTYAEAEGYSSGEENEDYDITKTYCVFAVKYNVVQNQSGSATRIKMFCMSVYDLRLSAVRYYGDEYSHETPETDFLNLSKLNPLELCQIVLGGVYQARLNGVDGSAVVTSAWITDMVTPNDQPSGNIQEVIRVTLKSKLGSAKNDIILNAKAVEPKVYTKRFYFDNDVNRQYYFGTLQNGLKLPRVARDRQSVGVKCAVGSDRLTIIAYYGDKQMDITNTFALTIGNVDGDISAQRQTLDTLKHSLGMIGGVLATAKGLATGNPVSALIGVSHTASSAMGLFEKKTDVGGIVEGGDGMTAFYNSFTGSSSDPYVNLQSPLRNPYVLSSVLSVDDEGASLNLNGASFNDVVTFSQIFSAPIFSGAMTETYLKADCIVTGVPTEASDYIRSRFLEGVYLKDIR